MSLGVHMRPPVQAGFHHNPVVVLAGSHGGAGTTTLHCLLSAVNISTIDCGSWWNPTQLPAGLIVVVVRSTAFAMSRATNHLTNLAYHRRPADVLCVVADGPWPYPKAVRSRLHMLSDRVRLVTEIPYVESWRYLDNPFDEQLPKKMQKVMDRFTVDLRQLATGVVPVPIANGFV